MFGWTGSTDCKSVQPVRQPWLVKQALSHHEQGTTYNLRREPSNAIKHSFMIGYHQLSANDEYQPPDVSKLQGLFRL